MGRGASEIAFKKSTLQYGVTIDQIRAETQSQDKHLYFILEFQEIELKKYRIPNCFKNWLKS